MPNFWGRGTHNAFQDIGQGNLEVLSVAILSVTVLSVARAVQLWRDELENWTLAQLDHLHATEVAHCCKLDARCGFGLFSKLMDRRNKTNGTSKEKVLRLE